MVRHIASSHRPQVGRSARCCLQVPGCSSPRCPWPRTAARTSPAATPASPASPPTAAPAATAPTPPRARCSSPTATPQELCLTCHGAAGTGATTDVETGVQYALGARRCAARPCSAPSAPAASSRPAWTPPTRRASRIRTPSASAAAGQGPGSPATSRGRSSTPAPVTSAHIALAEHGSSRPGVAWGNGGLGTAAPAPAVSHDLHDLPQPARQRELPDPQPDPGRGRARARLRADRGRDRRRSSSPTARWTTRTRPSPTRKNYTVIQTGRGTLAGHHRRTCSTPTTSSTRTTRRRPATTGTSASPGSARAAADADAPNGRPAERTPAASTAFNDQMTTWCTACHTRYYSE